MSEDGHFITNVEFGNELERLSQGWDADLKGMGERFILRLDRLEERIVILEALTRAMRLPDELHVAGQRYVKEDVS